MPADAKKALLRELPKVDQVVGRAELAEKDFPAWAVVEATRRLIDGRREAILAGTGTTTTVDSAEVAFVASNLTQPSLRKVVNATGVVLHTNLGRAPLSNRALERVVEVCAGYSNLEYEIEHRKRGSRHDHLARGLARLLGCEAALVVNNNAAAVLLGLAALAQGGEVIVSRGELVEIGGSFRIPDVMQWSGAHLVEVGTTNKTHPRDYEQAITEKTKLLLKVHQSNFAIVGFTSEATVADMVAIGRQRNQLVMVDLGSGSYESPHDLGTGLPQEPSIRETLQAGADMITFSGDKLLGGPQAGVLIGSNAAISKARKHPLMRTLRPDKMTLAALEGTLELYRDGRRDEVPTVNMLSGTVLEMKVKAEKLAKQIGEVPGVSIDICDTKSAVGGGALPLGHPASSGLRLVAKDKRSAEALDTTLRGAKVPVVGKILDDALWLDVRTIFHSEFDMVCSAVRALARGD